MIAENRFSFRKILKLKTICVGESFSAAPAGPVDDVRFPNNVLNHWSDFQFIIFPDFSSALTAIRSDPEIDLVFIDADDHVLTSVTMFVTQLREIGVVF